MCLYFKRDPKEDIMLKPMKVLLTRLPAQRVILVMMTMRLHWALPVKGGPWNSEPLYSLLMPWESAQAYWLEINFFLKDPTIMASHELPTSSCLVFSMIGLHVGCGIFPPVLWLSYLYENKPHSQAEHPLLCCQGSWKEHYFPSVSEPGSVPLSLAREPWGVSFWGQKLCKRCTLACYHWSQVLLVMATAMWPGPISAHCLFERQVLDLPGTNKRKKLSAPHTPPSFKMARLFLPED